jgi:hypothetical protein
MMGLASLLLLLSACEKDRVGLDNKVTVLFSTVTADYDTSDAVVRSAGVGQPETVIVPLDDNLYLSATLRPDPVDELRSDELRASLFNNQRVRFAAYNGTSKVGNTVNYTYNGSVLVPTSGNPLMLEADNGVTYHFVAYSYYGDPTTSPAETNIALSKRLVWGFSDQTITTATEAGRKVNINMKHKFLQVRVKVDASTIASAIMAISGVEIVGGRNANLTVREGTLSGSTELTQDVTSTLTGTGATRTSDYYLFYPSPTQVKIGSLTLTIDGEDKTYSGLSAAFTQALTGGTNYTLVVDVRESLWAYSNIYWDETLNSGAGGLTFDKVSTGSHPDYVGVHFKWGSLVGISPVGDKENALLYIPPVNGGNWDGTKRINSEGKPWAGVNYSDIPYMASIASPSLVNDLYDHPNFPDYKGDICSYLTTGAWRMPNNSELFGVETDYVHGTLTNFDPNDATGKGLLGLHGLTYYSAYGTVYLPASGDRTSDGEMVYIGRRGVYYCGSAGAISSTGSGLGFSELTNDSRLSFNIRSIVSFGYTIRCIKTLPTD